MFQPPLVPMTQLTPITKIIVAGGSGGGKYAIVLNMGILWNFL